MKWFATTWMEDTGRNYMIRNSEHRYKFTAIISAKLRCWWFEYLFPDEDSGIFWKVQKDVPIKIDHWLFSVGGTHYTMKEI